MSSETRTKAPAGAAPPDALDQGRFPPGALVARRYRVVALLGRGGMGEVYRAEDLKLRQAVALKFLPSHLQSDPGRLARFHREVRRAREVSHPNVCRVHDIGEVDGLHFLSMEYVDGEDLGSLLRRIGRLPRDKAIEVARQVCGGLAAAHDRGVVHRDLKPANIMIDGRGRVRITDFGLAVAEEEAAGEVAGTPGYMAPEQLAGAPASVRTDVYALGLVLYEVMTGRPAFAGGSAPEILRRQRDAPPKPSSVVPDLEPRIERVILRCLEKDPAQRPPSALAVAAALPGGDPLAALVAAGETPPPEMVAAPLALWIAGGITLVGRVALDKPPEVLADRARDVLGRLGYPPGGRHEAFGFRYDHAALAAREWSRAVRFWYRVSPDPLQPRNPFASVSPDDPPPLAPGMATVWLDAHGRLLSFQVVPPSVPAAPGGMPQWEPVFGEAGLDPSRFLTAEASRPPPVGADALQAWTGSDALFSIAAALKARGNRIVYFAGYKRPADLYKRRAIEDACDLVVWSVDEGPAITPHRPLNRSVLGNDLGRTGIFEVLPMTEKIRRLVSTQAGSLDIFRAVREEGMRTLKEAAVEKVFRGITTTTEMVRVTGK